jgi:hypothetical protein
MEATQDSERIDIAESRPVEAHAISWVGDHRLSAFSAPGAGVVQRCRIVREISQFGSLRSAIIDAAADPSVMTVHL